MNHTIVELAVGEELKRNTTRRKKPAVMIWSRGVVWLQTVGEHGQERLSHCGRISIEEARAMCADLKIQLFSVSE